MHAELLQMAADLTRLQQPFVLALVVRRRPASSAQAGDMAIITAAGQFHGWLGGSCIQPTVVREARQALAEGKPRLLALTPDPETERRPGVAVFPMTCHSGGSVEIYLEPIQPATRLVIFGESPTARALARLGAAMGYAVVPVTNAAAVHPGAAGDPAAAAAAPAAAAIAAGGEATPAPAANLAPAPAAALGATLPAAGSFAVVATMGEDDEAAIRAALALAPAYLGVVASARRFAQMRPILLHQGVGEEQLATIRSPAGLAIGAQTPEEIALSVLAEMVERRHALAAAAGAAATGAGMAAGSPQARQSADPEGRAADLAAGGHPAGPRAEASRTAADGTRPAPAPGQAIDPICGMTVEIAGARHTAEHGGRIYHFCCAGCRQRFLSAPASHATAGAA